MSTFYIRKPQGGSYVRFGAFLRATDGGGRGPTGIAYVLVTDGSAAALRVAGSASTPQIAGSAAGLAPTGSGSSPTPKVTE